MEVYMKANETRYLTVTQFIKVYEGRWPSSESALRAIILNADLGKNNFQLAFKRVGRRVLVDEAGFWRCVERDGITKKKIDSTT